MGESASGAHSCSPWCQRPRDPPVGWTAKREAGPFLELCIWVISPQSALLLMGPRLGLALQVLEP